MHKIIDVSSNNTHPIAWGNLRARGIDAVIVKATEGLTYKNPYYMADVQGARAAGMGVAGYHFARFNDPGGEANFFHSVAGMDAKVLDVETSTNVGWINMFLTVLGQRADQEMTYGSANTIPGGVRGLLWVAAWGSVVPNAGETMWQYSDNWNGFDISVWEGDEAAFQTFFGGVAPPKPPPSPPPPKPTPVPTPPPRPTEVTVNVPVLSISSPGPNVVSAPVRNLQTLLSAHGYYPGGIDGRFGARTAAAVVACERAMGLGVDSGIAGAQVWEALCTR